MNCNISEIIALFFINVIILTSACSQNAKVVEKISPKEVEVQVDEVSGKADNELVEAFPEKLEKIEKTEEEWREILTTEEFRILREEGTERAFTGKYWDNKKAGTYYCSGCELALFESKTKFKSGTGWPSFYQPIKKEYVGEKTDNKHGWNRTEVVCGRCDGHLGHVFDDGPAPTGLRYCINGNILTFKESSQ